MAEFNYRNAYRLAIQTNRELHASIEAYKVLLDAAKDELEKCYEQINKLEHEKEDLRIEVKNYKEREAWTPPQGMTNIDGFYGNFG